MVALARRTFLQTLGAGALLAGVPRLILAAAREGRPLELAELERWARMLEQTELEELQPRLVRELSAGLPLATLVAAGALANARRFGGADYVGFHVQMALLPAYQMSRHMPAGTEPLPVLKVLYRHRKHLAETRAPLDLAALEAGAAGEPRAALVDLIHATDLPAAESTLDHLAAASPERALSELMAAVREQVDVHRIVLAWRAFDAIRLTGPQHATTLLRQSVRYCINLERSNRDKSEHGTTRATVAAALAEHDLETLPPARAVADAEIEELARELFLGSRAGGAACAAAALADGWSPGDLCDALALAANLLLLHDPGRAEDEPGRRAGSVHGASGGVHASDSADAWRRLTELAPAKDVAANLVTAAYHTAGQRSRRPEHPFDADTTPPDTRDPHQLLQQLEVAIRAGDQAQAMSVTRRYRALDHAAGPLFQQLLAHAVSEDGALHAEKYYATVQEEYGRARPAFRDLQLVGLARVTASEFGDPAPGQEEARRLLART